MDLAEQKLIKEFKPASQLPDHLHLIDTATQSEVDRTVEAYDPKKNYLQKFWKQILENEQVQNDVEYASKSNYSDLKRIYNLQEYYENNLIPRLFSFPT